MVDGKKPSSGRRESRAAGSGPAKPALTPRVRAAPLATKRGSTKPLRLRASRVSSPAVGSADENGERDEGACKKGRVRDASGEENSPPQRRSSRMKRKRNYARDRCRAN